MKRPVLIELLRERARAGACMCELVDTMRTNLDVPMTAFGAIKLAMDAFDIPLPVARKLEGARCMGNGAITNDAVDALMAPFIQAAVSRDT